MEESKRAWLARDKNRKLYLYQWKPTKMDDHWTYEGEKDIGLMPDDMFEEIKWEDKEPTEVEIIIKKK